MTSGNQARVNGASSELAGNSVPSPFLDDNTSEPLMVDSSPVNPQAAIKEVAEALKIPEPASEGNAVDEEEISDVSGRASSKSRALLSVKPALHVLWRAGTSYVTEAVQMLANASRDPTWRLPMGESGLLACFITVLSTVSSTDALIIQSLRLIGNSCADTDANRQIVVASNALSAIKALIFRPQLVPYVIPVLFNICMDYEPAQRLASESHVSKALVDLMQSPAMHEHMALVGYICKILDMLAAQPTELDNASPNTAVVLFSLVEDETDDEDFLALTTSGIAYLQHPIFQEALLTESLEHTLDIMSKSYDRPAEASEDLESDVPEQLTTMRNNMTVALSDISVLPSFPAKYPINSDLTDRLQNWLSSPHKQLQICACVMLGNMARSVETCIELVQTRRILVPLLNILKTTNDPQLLHSTIGFLKNLALPLPNKTPLGEAGTIEAIEKLWTLSTQAQLQYSSISLTRQLCISTVSNVQRICADSTSRIITLLSVFRSTDSTPTKMEIARLFATIGRVYATLPEDSIDSAQTFFGENPAIAEPLAYLIPQKEWPAIRSEGYFVMALMARTTKGAAIVAGVLEDDAAMQAITQLFAAPESEVFVAGVEGEQGPEADAKKGKALQSKDRENVLVLLNELLKHGGSALKEDSRARLEILLKNGGEVHL